MEPLERFERVNCSDHWRLRRSDPKQDTTLTPAPFLHIGLILNSCYDASLRCIGDAQLREVYESDHIEKSAAGN